MSKWWSIVILTCSVLSVGFAGYTLASAGSSAPQTPSAVQEDARGIEIPQPAGWVPFSAKVVVSHADRGVTAQGMFYRDGHGCARLETGPGDEAWVITIHNVPENRYFVYSKRTEKWTQGPMRVPPEGWSPIRMRVGTAGLTEYPLRVEVRKGEQYDLRSDSGFTAYRYVNLSGTLSLMVPELNHFEVMKQTLEGRREAYSDVKMGEPSQDLFYPPPDAVVVVTSEVRGIVAQDPALAGQHVDAMIRGERH